MGNINEYFETPTLIKWGISKEKACFTKILFLGYDDSSTFNVDFEFNLYGVELENFEKHDLYVCVRVEKRDILDNMGSEIKIEPRDIVDFKIIEGESPELNVYWADKIENESSHLFTLEPYWD